MTVLGVHPARLDLVVHPGDQVDFSVPVLDAAGDAQDLSGWTVAATATGPGGQVLHNFTAVVSSTSVRVTADGLTTAAWNWSAYAARLVVTGQPSGGSAVELAAGWIRLYRP